MSKNGKAARHREKYAHYLKTGKKHTNVVVFCLMNHAFGIDNCKIELIENYPAETKAMLQKQEGHYISHYINNADCPNKKVEGRTRKKYQEDNREKISVKGNNCMNTTKNNVLRKE